MLTIFATILIIFPVFSQGNADPATVISDAEIWGGCEEWTVVITGVFPDPDIQEDNLDILYACNGCFKDGLSEVTASYPGSNEDQFNGGKWSLHELTLECQNDPECIGKYSTICSRNDPNFDRLVNKSFILHFLYIFCFYSNDFESIDFYFGCTLNRFNSNQENREGGKGSDDIYKIHSNRCDGLIIIKPWGKFFLSSNEISRRR